MAEQTKSRDHNPVARAIAAAGGTRRVAMKLNVSTQAVSKWRRRLPAERVIELEQLTRGAVSRYDLRPDLYPREGDAA